MCVCVCVCVYVCVRVNKRQDIVFEGVCVIVSVYL